MRIFFDMDGTLAKWNNVAFEQLYTKGYYRNLKPNPQIINDAKTLISSGKDVYVLSAYITDSEYALQEKKEWLNEYLPEIPQEKQLFVPYGDSKAEFLKSRNLTPITATDYLIDDYTINLQEWNRWGGTGIKYLNGINHTKGTWKGLMVDYSTEQAAKQKPLLKVIDDNLVRKKGNDFMKINIYQVNSNRDKNRVAFENYDSLERWQGTNDIDSKVYDLIYSGEFDYNNLEEVYTKFNVDLPTDYKGRSMSVSDIVEIEESTTLSPGFYFCDTVGFKKVDFDKSLVSTPTANDKISVVLCEPGQLARVAEIGTSLSDMQQVVGGYIERCMPFEDDVAIVCNEEGKIIGLPLNRAVYSDDKEMIEVISGTFFICATPTDSEKFQSLPEDKMNYYLKKFKYPEEFIRGVDGEIVAIPCSPKLKDLLNEVKAELDAERIADKDYEPEL